MGLPPPERLASLDTAPEKICAVVVTYNPGTELERNLYALRAETDRVIVVDNNSTPDARGRVQSSARAIGATVLWNADNLGLATALNIGVQQALHIGDCDWIGTFDQDTFLVAGFRQEVLQAWSACPFRAEVALIAPYHLLFPQTLESRATQVSIPAFAERSVVLQSGSIFRSDVFKRVGLLDDSFFIDNVDFEFCLRLRKQGFRIIEAPRTTAIHSVGAPTLHRLLRRTFVAFNHSPLRWYYITRNRLRLYGRYALTDPGWILKDGWGWLKHTGKVMLFENDRWEKASFMLRGACDAVRGRSGRYQECRGRNADRERSLPTKDSVGPK